MASLSATLTEYSTEGNSRTYTAAGHTYALPKIVVQKRKLPSGSQPVAEFQGSVIYGTEDDDGLALQSKYNFTVNARMPVNGQTTHRDAALVLFRDFVASDEFTAAVSSLGFVE